MNNKGADLKGHHKKVTIRRAQAQTDANNLQAFLNEVEAIREQYLSSEAYALLRFNGEHLLHRMGLPR